MSTSGGRATTNTNNPEKYYELTPSATDSVSSLSFSPRADILVATSWDTQVRCWEISSSEASISGEPKVLCSSWKDDGTTVFTGGCDKQAKMWPLLSGVEPFTVAMHDAPIQHMAWIPGMNLLVTGSWDQTLKYWDTRQPNPAHTQQLPDKCYALTVKESLMVVATADRKLIVFDLQKPQVEFKRIESSLMHQTRCLATFPDKKGFLVGSIGGDVGVHHLDDAQESKNYTFKCHRVDNTIWSVNSLNFHPIHGTFASTGSDGTFCFWDKGSRLRLKVMSKYDQPIPCSTFNHNGSIFAYAVCHDWSKGAENHKPDAAKTSIFLHQPEENTVKARTKLGRFTVTKLGRFTDGKGAI